MKLKRSLRCFLIIPIFILCFFPSASAHTIRNQFDHLTTEDGLSQGNVEFVFQDSKGFIWIGTFNGLNRFDGYRFRVFNHEPGNPSSLGHEHVASICEDAEGKLWIGTYGAGLSVFIPETETFVNIDTIEIEDRKIGLKQSSMVALGPEGNIWYSDELTGVFVFNTDMELVKYYRNDPENQKSIPQSYYFGTLFDKEGNVWFGIGNGMLGKKTPDSEDIEIFRFESRVVQADDGIKSMFIDSKQNIWIGTTSQGAYRFDPKTETFINYRKENPVHSLPVNTVMAFMEDKDGDIYIGTDGGGIIVLNPLTNERYRIQYSLGNPQSLSANAVYSMYFDRSGNFWVGTYSGGVNIQSRYKNKFRSFKPDPIDTNSLSYKNVTSVLQDREGEIWIGTDGGGLNRFNVGTETFRHYRADPENPDWLQTDVIIHLMEDSDGDIFIASYNHGLTIFNKYDETFKQYVPDESNPQSISGIHPWYTFEDSYGQIWVGLLAVGLDKFDKATETFTNYASVVGDPTTLNSPNVKVIYEDRNRELWIGTEGGGLHKYNREQDNFTRYFYEPDNSSALSNNDVRALYEDTDNRYWVGTGNGLCLMNRDSGTFKTYTKLDGLPGNTINGILEDNTGLLWISTDAGLTKFDPDSLTFRNYDVTDGLSSNEYNYTAATKTREGLFYFGSKGGFDVFRPSEIQDNPYPPPVVITELVILEESYFRFPTKKRGDRNYKSVNYIDEFKFSHKQNIINFEFSALDYSNPVKNIFEYKLEGFDEDWKQTGADRRYATYMNLPGGDYTFRVRAANGDGIWNKDGKSIEITVTPPFYKRTWFIILVILIILVLVIRFIRNREDKLKEEKELLQRKIDEGLEAVNKQKAEFEKKDEELKNRIESEKQQRWYNEGMVRISQVMSQKKDDLRILSQGIITELVEYLGVRQGAIYILNDENEDDPHLVLQAAYAPDNERVEGKRIELEEGQIGACFKEKEVVTADNLPQGYAVLSSGLGEEHLRCMALIPLKLNEIIIGVVELLSLDPIEEYRVEFVAKSGETLTSILTALKASDQTQRMLEKQKAQAEEMAAQEEELRQNLEEMQATQEELERMKEIDKEKQALLEREQYLFDALLRNANEFIYFKDKESKFIRFSHSMIELFNVKSEDEILGKSDFDLFAEEHARPAFEDEQKIIATGEPILDQIEKEVHKDGSVTYVSTTKKPLYNQKGEIVGTWGISKDITATRKMKEEIENSKEKLITDEALLKGIVKGLKGNVCLFNEEGLIEQLNDGFAGRLGKKEDKLINQPLFGILEEEEKSQLKSKLNEVKKKGNITWTEKSGQKSLTKQLLHIKVSDIDKDFYLLLEV